MKGEEGNMASEAEAWDAHLMGRRILGVLAEPFEAHGLQAETLFLRHLTLRLDDGVSWQIWKAYVLGERCLKVLKRTNDEAVEGERLDDRPQWAALQGALIEEVVQEGTRVPLPPPAPPPEP